MSEKPTTIRDIATLAGVSAGTVSRVMNDLPGVGAETRKRVAALIAEHDFRGDATARQLSRGRAESIGIVFPLQVSEVIMHPVYPELLGAITDAAQASGQDVLLLTTTDTADIQHILDAVKRKRVDGLILPAASSDDPLITALEDRGVPTVLIGHRQSGERMTWVDCTHDGAMEELTTGLIHSGRRRLRLVNGPRHISAYALRSEGFWRAVRASDAEGLVAVEVEDEMSYAAGLRLGSEWVAGDDEADAVVCSADSTAAGLLEALSRAGKSVPQDIALTGFDDSDYSRHTTPPLTTVRMPLAEAGSRALSALLELIADPSVVAPPPTVLATTLVTRASSGS